MSDQIKGEVPETLTPRLVFDDASIEDAVPQFLRGKTTEPREPGDPVKHENVCHKIEEPEEPVAVTTPVEVAVDPADTPEVGEPIQAPATGEEPATTEVETRTETHTETHEAVDGASDDDLSVEELQRQQEELNRKIQAKREAEKKAVIEQIVNVVNTYNIPIEELVDALGGLKIKRKGVKAEPKYRDPATGALWSGRGKEPAWIRGKDRKPFLIVK